MEHNNLEFDIKLCMTKVDDIVKKVDKLENNQVLLQNNEVKLLGESLLKLQMLSENQDGSISKLMEELKESRLEFMRMVKEQELSLKKLSDSMVEMSNNMNIMNDHIKDLQDSHTSLKNKVSNNYSKIDEIANNSKIDLLAILRSSATTLITSAIVGILTYIFVMRNK